MMRRLLRQVGLAGESGKDSFGARPLERQGRILLGAVGDLDVVRLGPLVECHTRFPGRTNVQLVRVTGRHELEIGIWERGVGATRSSGSSAVAAAAAAVANGWVESPVTVRVPGGGALTVTLAGGGARLAGPVEEICRGELVFRRPRVAS